MDSRRQSLEEDLREYERLLGITQNPRVQAILTTNIQRVQDEIAAIPVAAPVAPVAEEATFQPIEKFAWDQEGKKVKVYITSLPSLKSHPRELIDVQHDSEMVDIKVRNVQGVSYRFFIKRLSKPISDCRLTTSSKGFTLTLQKAEDGHWDSLAYKPTPLNKAKEKDAEGKSKDPKGDLMDLMRDLYENGDDEMRRAIGQAWTKSRDEKPGLH